MIQGKLNLTCHHCGGHHFALECKFYNVECHRHKKIGHNAKSKSVSSGPKSTHSLQDSEISMTDGTSYELFMM